MAAEQCGDFNPVVVQQAIGSLLGSSASTPADECKENQHGSEHDESIDDVSEADNADDAAQCNVQAVECHATSTRHDDWLHRGVFLADLPWYAYMMRVQRVRKPTEANADHSELFFFDNAHFPHCIVSKSVMRARPPSLAWWDRCARQRKNKTGNHMLRISSCSFLVCDVLVLSIVPTR